MNISEPKLDLITAGLVESLSKKGIEAVVFYGESAGPEILIPQGQLTQAAILIAVWETWICDHLEVEARINWHSHGNHIALYCPGGKWKSRFASFAEFLARV